MTPTQEVQDRIRQFLLGKLPVSDREEFEKALLTDEQILAELLIIEEELTDEYLGGRLTVEDRTSFENHFLSTPERQEAFHFAEALKRYVDSPRNERDDSASFLPWLLSTQARRLAIAASVLVIVGGVLWFFFLREQSPGTVMTVALAISASTRDEGAQVQKLEAPGKRTLRLVLKLPNSSAAAVAYRAQLLNSNGETQSLKVSGGDAQSVWVDIPGAKLQRGQYALNLFAIKADGNELRLNGSYYFAID